MLLHSSVTEREAEGAPSHTMVWENPEPHQDTRARTEHTAPLVRNIGTGRPAGGEQTVAPGVGAGLGTTGTDS